MKNLLLISFLCFCLPSFAKKEVPVLNLEEAIRMQKISANFNYLRKGREHKRVLMTARNRTRKGLKVCVPTGTYFRSENPGWQDHLVTKSDTVFIKPLSVAYKSLTAFCCESGDGGPQKMSRFFLEKNPNSTSIELCKLIEDYGFHDYSAQRAIWQLFNRKTPNRIVGRDSTTVMVLRNFVGRVLDLPVDIYKPDVYIKSVSTRRPVAFHNKGIFRLKDVQTSDKIEIQLFSAETDELVNNVAHNRIFVQEKSLCLFMHDIKIGTLSPYEDYIVRVSKNGVVQEEWLYETS